MQTVHDIIAAIMHRLEKRHKSDFISCQQDAWWILQHITKRSEAELVASGSIALTDTQKKQLDEILKAHVDKHEPLQYLLGSVPFLDLEILVEPPILIPRPETEEWCQVLIKKLMQLTQQDITILDIGSGSGCIALSISRALPQAQVYAVDINTKAIELTKKNAVHNGITSITVMRSSFFESIPHTMKFDLIVSNPPYIGLDEWPTLDHSVRDWEDKHALLSGKDGLEAIRHIISKAKQWIKQNKEMSMKQIPQLVIEIGYEQGSAVKELLLDAHYTVVSIEKDLEGKDRVAYAGI
jgi:release factor glutamine methyltransferase